MPTVIDDLAKDLEVFRAVPPRKNFKLEDFTLPDGSPMIGNGRLLVPPSHAVQAVYNAAQRMFSSKFDESMRDSYVNARAMRRDGFLWGLLWERLLPTMNRDWRIEVDDDRDSKQMYVRDSMTKIVESTPQFSMLKWSLLQGVWFGRSAVQGFFQRDPDCNNFWVYGKNQRCKDQTWSPVHGDSIQYTFDGIPAILMDSMTTSWYANHGAKWGGDWKESFDKDKGIQAETWGDGDLRYTDRGGCALVLQREQWRERFVIHQHVREPADFFEGILAGSIQGLGLRGMVYWLYVLRTDALTWMITYMQAIGQMDLLVFNYPAGDAAGKLQAEINANKIIGKAAIVCPRRPDQNWNAVEQIQMNSAGLKALQDLVRDFFDRHIERLFVGQSMSSGADKGDGLGGTGRAELSRATKDELLVYDTNRLDEVLTNDLLAPLKKYNFPWAKFPVRFKSILPDLEKKEKVQSGKLILSMGGYIKLDELMEAGDFSRPEEGDEVVIQAFPGGPTIVTKMGPQGPELPQMGQLPPVMPPDGMPGQGPVPPGSPLDPSMMMGVQPTAPPMQLAQVPSPAGIPGPMPGHAVPPGGGISPPMQFFSSGKQPGTPPVNGPVLGHQRYMGFPGGNNTFIPSFGQDRRKPQQPIGFTRYERRQAPVAMTYRDKPYRKGQYIPGSVMFQHSPPRKPGFSGYPKPAMYMEPTAEDFERKIDENPHEYTTHGAYADFLEENGQPEEAQFRRNLGEWYSTWKPPKIPRHRQQEFADRPWVVASPGGFAYGTNDGRFPKGVENFGYHIPGETWAWTGEADPDGKVKPHHGRWDDSTQTFAWPSRHAMEEAFRQAYVKNLGTQQPPTQASRYDDAQPQQQQDTGSVHHPVDWTNHDTFASSIANALVHHVQDPDQAAHLAGQTFDMLKSFSPNVIERLRQGRLSHIVSHQSQEHVGNHWTKATGQAADDPNSQFTAPNGFHDPDVGHVHLHAGGNDPMGVLAHEVAHALDWSHPAGKEGGYHQLSTSDEWKKAWHKEIKSGNLNEYSAIDPTEGFGEAFRLAHATPNGRETLKQKFPETHRVFAKWGIV